MKKKDHLVSWTQVSPPIEASELGVRPVEVVNEALLAKWLWITKPVLKAQWKSLLCAKYNIGSFG